MHVIKLDEIAGRTRSAQGQTNKVLAYVSRRVNTDLEFCTQSRYDMATGQTNRRTIFVLSWEIATASNQWKNCAMLFTDGIAWAPLYQSKYYSFIWQHYLWIDSSSIQIININRGTRTITQSTHTIAIAHRRLSSRLIMTYQSLAAQQSAQMSLTITTSILFREYKKTTTAERNVYDFVNENELLSAVVGRVIETVRHIPQDEIWTCMLLFSLHTYWKYHDL